MAFISKIFRKKNVDVDKVKENISNEEFNVFVSYNILEKNIAKFPSAFEKDKEYEKLKKETKKIIKKAESKIKEKDKESDSFGTYEDYTKYSSRPLSRAYSADSKRSLKETMFSPQETKKYDTGAIRIKPTHSTSAELKQRIENFISLRNKKEEKVGSPLVKSSSLEIYNDFGIKLLDFEIPLPKPKVVIKNKSNKFMFAPKTLWNESETRMICLELSILVKKNKSSRTRRNTRLLSNEEVVIFNKNPKAFNILCGNNKKK